MPRLRRFRPLRAESLESRLNLAALTVNTNADNTTSDAVLTLREAIALVNNQGNANAALGRALTTGEAAQVNTNNAFGVSDVISFGPAATNTFIALSGSRLNITRSVSISGPGADKLILDAQSGRQHFFIDGRSNGSITVLIHGLTFFNGNANGSGGTVTGGVDNSIRGGSIFNDSATVVINESYFAVNTATFGGAIYTLGGTTTLQNSTVYNNTATTSGGGINNNGGVFNLIQSTVSTNQATTFAGGVVTSGAMTIRQSTIVSNTTNTALTAAGGVYTTAGSIALFNTLIVGNKNLADNSARDIGGFIATGGYNFIGTTHPAYNGGFVNGQDGNILQSAEAASVVSAFGNYGGTVPTHLPLANSAILDKGSNTEATLTLDQRGSLRILDGPDVDTTATADIGAVEGSFRLGPYVVTVADDEDDGNLAANDLSLREAIRLANVNPAADIITFASGITDIVLTLDELPLTDSARTTIDGAQVTVRRHSQAPEFSVFTVDSNAVATLRGLRIADGKSKYGGGGVNNLGDLTLENATIEQNSTNAVTRQGGGIINLSTLTVLNSTIRGNTAYDGGGIYNIGELNVFNSTISGNSAETAAGGLYHGGTTAILTNVTLTRNRVTVTRGDVRGGGVYISRSATITLRNTIVAGNTSGDADAADDLLGNVTAESSFNVIGDAASAGGLVNGVNGNKVGFEAASVLDASLADNGGPTLTHALVSGSPAINAGDNALVPVGVTTDQRGLTRIIGGRVDIGAVESDVAPAPTTTVVSVSPNPAVSGQQIDFYFEVTSANGSPSGEVAVTLDAGSPIHFSPLGALGAFTFRRTAGSHTYSASYLGNDQFAPSSSTLLTFTVNKAATTTTVSAVPRPFNNARLTANVAVQPESNRQPTGTVTFFVDGQSSGSVSVSAQGVAMVDTNALTPGLHTFRAVYNGDSELVSSSSEVGSFTVGSNQAPTGVTLADPRVREASPAAVVGMLTVIDPNAGDTYTFAVSDSRFEVVAGQLRLKSGAQVNFADGDVIPLTITVTDNGGLSSPAVPFAITVRQGSESYPYHSYSARSNVDRRDGVDPADILWVLYYYDQQPGPLPTPPDGDDYPLVDTFADGSVDPQDILQAVTDYLAAQGGEGEGNAASAAPMDAAAVNDAAIVSWLLAEEQAAKRKARVAAEA